MPVSCIVIVIVAAILVAVIIQWQRCMFYFNRSSRLIVLGSGLALEVVAIARWGEWQPWSSVFAGVGGSVLATVLVGFWALDADEAYQAFLQHGVTRFYPDREQSHVDWVGKLREAKHRCILLGQAHGGWSNDRTFRPALLDRVRAGVGVEIFFLDPTGDAARVRAAEDRKNIEPLLSRTKASISVVWAIRKELDQQLRDRMRLYVYNATPSLGLNWFDTTMFAAHYLGGLTNSTSPLLRVEYRPGPDTLYAVYEENVEVIRDNFSTMITDANVAKYTRRDRMSSNNSRCGFSTSFAAAARIPSPRRTPMTCAIGRFSRNAAPESGT